MGHIQMLEYMSGQTLEGQVSDWLPPALIPEGMADAVAERMLSMLVISEDLPLPDNRVRVTADGRIHLDYTYNNLEGHERLVGILKQSLDGFVDHAHPISQHHFQFDSLLPLYGTAHQAGTVRFGVDPRASSVLDPWCKAARAGQPLCGRHQLLPLDRRGEPHPDHRRQRHAGRRPPGRERLKGWAPPPPNTRASAHPVGGVEGLRAVAVEQFARRQEGVQLELLDLGN